MEWHYLREILLNRHRDRGFGADWSKREAASVGGLFHFKRKCDVGFWHKAALAHLLHSHLADSVQGEGPVTFTHCPARAFRAPIHHALQSKVSGCPRSSL